jgi:hypothetical protein
MTPCAAEIVIGDWSESHAREQLVAGALHTEARLSLAPGVRILHEHRPGDPAPDAARTFIAVGPELKYEFATEDAGWLDVLTRVDGTMTLKEIAQRLGVSPERFAGDAEDALHRGILLMHTVDLERD